MNKYEFVIEGIPEASTEDDGQAFILTLDSSPAGPEGIFIRIQSWHEDGDHIELLPLADKRLRVTIEVVE